MCVLTAAACHAVPWWTRVWAARYDPELAVDLHSEGWGWEGEVDPWGRPLLSRSGAFCRMLGGRTTLVYSCGPNGVDDGGAGDDLYWRWRPAGWKRLLSNYARFWLPLALVALWPVWAAAVGRWARGAWLALPAGGYSFLVWYAVGVLTCLNGRSPSGHGPTLAILGVIGWVGVWFAAGMHCVESVRREGVGRAE